MSKLISHKDITAYKNIEGAWVLSATVPHFGVVTHRYYYFTLREAERDFYHRING